MTVRPALRCLRDDLKLALPAIDTPLDEVDHPVLRKANDQFAGPTGPRERIRGLDDIVAFKVKVQRWRGAVLDDGQPSWLLVAGIREDGSRDDFYEALTRSAKAARVRRNSEEGASPGGKTTFSAPWLPTEDDCDRYNAEGSVRLVRSLRGAIHELVCGSLLDGREHETEIAGTELGILVQGTSDRETYVALRFTGPVPEHLVAVVLDLVPGCDRDGWYPEFALPDRPLRPGEHAYSNVMDPAAAAVLLERQE